MSRVQSFQPIIDRQARVLILGSMPGVQSLREQQYYANPHNQFWRILYTLFSSPLDLDYSRRLKFIEDKGIALWDVIAACNREGSLDTNIKNETVNDFPTLFNTCSNLTAVVFNGTKAYETYRKRVGFNLPNLIYKQLPSTSPANTLGFAEKLKQWAIILSFLEGEG
ncbi:DNA-deoxyinosine glycosylase [Desulfosporosinus sp. PR]|uniref:DNA-deoxyinosine glycosylase n=1 Tax=Candidatus Desulfosporosinus nitrosoreducens TaxID=3401928 RepID=UPI0027FC6672|nr:DNA-deoxyinosine glycosylase [Desulfosporosinus sp. PR]MDQ7096781.1 DNA-deoxyinosine glycosylase [Desulfosporosinus sp. PR]